jgi:hypothetical protein
LVDFHQSAAMPESSCAEIETTAIPNGSDDLEDRSEYVVIPPALSVFGQDEETSPAALKGFVQFSDDNAFPQKILLFLDGGADAPVAVVAFVEHDDTDVGDAPLPGSARRKCAAR